MLARILGAAAVSFLLASPALAFQCPVDIGKIDAALAANPSISADDNAKVMKLRNEGESLHEYGSHKDAMETLAEAKKILGIE